MERNRFEKDENKWKRIKANKKNQFSYMFVFETLPSLSCSLSVLVFILNWKSPESTKFSRTVIDVSEMDIPSYSVSVRFKWSLLERRK